MLERPSRGPWNRHARSAADFEPETPYDAEAILRLNERVFGPGRFARTAYRLRETTAADLSLSFVARVGTLLVGANAMTPIWIGETPALLLGPLIVEPVFRSRGIGEALVTRSLEAARAGGARLVVLVGDKVLLRPDGIREDAPWARHPAGAGRSGAGAALRIAAGRVRGREGESAGGVGARRSPRLQYGVPSFREKTYLPSAPMRPCMSASG